MGSLEPVPTIRRIETDRADLCAIDIVGNLSAADIENAYGLLDAAYALHEKIDLLVRFTDYEGVAWDGVLSAETMQGKWKALNRVQRYALVGAPGWMKLMLDTLGPLTSIESRHFDKGEEAEAWAWLGAREIVDEV